MSKRRDWQKTLTAWKASNKTVQQFCRENKISISGFYQAKKRLDSESKVNNPEPTAKPNFISIQTERLVEKNEPMLRLKSSRGFTIEVFL